jgi:hypothetical protein
MLLNDTEHPQGVEGGLSDKGPARTKVLWVSARVVRWPGGDRVHGLRQTPGSDETDKFVPVRLGSRESEQRPG